MVKAEERREVFPAEPARECPSIVRRIRGRVERTGKPPGWLRFKLNSDKFPCVYISKVAGGMKYG